MMIQRIFEDQHSTETKKIIAGINGQSTRKDPWKIIFKYDYCCKTIICAKMERLKYAPQRNICPK